MTEQLEYQRYLPTIASLQVVKHLYDKHNCCQLRPVLSNENSIIYLFWPWQEQSVHKCICHY